MWWTISGLALDLVGVIMFAREAYTTSQRIPKGGINWQGPPVNFWKESSRAIITATFLMAVGFILQIIGAAVSS